MNTILILIGIGIGFFAASCLMFYIVHLACRDSAQANNSNKETNKVLLEQQRGIMVATERIAAALEKWSK